MCGTSGLAAPRTVRLMHAHMRSTQRAAASTTIICCKHLQHLQDSQQAIELAADQHTKARQRVSQVTQELQASAARWARVRSA